VLSTISGLVVFGTRGGVIGIGCVREIADARRLGLPVAILDHRCRARTYAGFASLIKAPTSRRAAVLVPGGPVDLRELFGLPPAKGSP
jgi:regulator of RNase E activity RraA